MSAAVCGSKRCLFEDIASTPSPPVSKKLRRCSPSSSSPIRSTATASLDGLSALFPQLDYQILERALQECANDLDATIKRLSEGYVDAIRESAESSGTNMEQGDSSGNINDTNSTDDSCAPHDSCGKSTDGTEWVESFVKEMMSSTTLDDARVRAARALEVLELSVSSRTEAEVAESFQEENSMLKEQMEMLFRENAILKRGVAIQHERQKLYEDNNQELQHLKQLVSQYHEQLRVLQVNNYALTMHLKQAEQRNSMGGHFHPDVF